ncbi:MAG TPA: hypothetical protein DD384_01650 [Firmicutes bacterium]|nr:hypothetical protein [Bacillota bacterium]
MDESLGIEFRQTAKVIKAHIGKLICDNLNEHQVKISTTEGIILHHVYNHRDKIVSSKDLMEVIGVSKATMSQTLASLIRKGLIEFEEWPEDGRVKRILLTKKAQSLEEDIDKALNDADRFFKEAFSQKELEELHFLMKKLREHIQNNQKAEVK